MKSRERLEAEACRMILACFPLREVSISHELIDEANSPSQRLL
jgi:hypothetical protein